MMLAHLYFYRQMTSLDEICPMRQAGVSLRLGTRKWRAIFGEIYMHIIEEFFLKNTSLLIRLAHLAFRTTLDKCARESIGAPN